MTAEEKLVESGNVSTPWSYHQEDDNLFGGSVVSRSWMYGDKGVYPYEFGYNSQFERTYPGLPAKNEFLEEFGQLLEEHQLTHLLGLTTISPNAPATMKVEKTWGRSNVVFTMDEEAPDAIGKDTIGAVWHFDAMQPNAKNNYRAMGCMTGCRCSI